MFWVHEGTILSVNQLAMRNDGRYVIRGRYNLVLINVTSRDEGDYTCQVSSSPVLEQVSTLTVAGWFELSALICMGGTCQDIQFRVGLSYRP